jgi:uncharacterized protein YukJ
MPLKNYAVLRGDISAFAGAEPGDNTPHFSFTLKAVGETYKVQVNVQSKVQPHTLQVALKTYNEGEGPQTFFTTLKNLPVGETKLATEGTKKEGSPDVEIDYIRNLPADLQLQPEDFHPVPYQVVNATQVSLHKILTKLSKEARDNKTTAEVYAFGELFPNGIHNIHMNQGSPGSGSFSATNGPKQDGALFIHRRVQGKDVWQGYFTYFGSQQWVTTDDGGEPTGIPRVNPLPGVRIVGAVIRGFRDGDGDEQEKVIVQNRAATGKAIALDGWELKDAQGGTYRFGERDTLPPLAQIIAAFHRADTAHPQLGNNGGTIQLVTPDGVVAHQVTYTAAQVAPRGFVTPFNQ